ncbi:MAG: universal stress protein [Myxococcales bacterium]|nr:universal stress protein [Myxococcales bacterium]
MNEPKKLLVPVDFSPCSAHALRYAAFLAESWGAEVGVVYVWEPPLTPSQDPTADVPYTAQEFQSQAAQRLDADLVAFIEHAQFPESVTVTRKTLRGDPKKRIVEEAVDADYDLVLLGTHGRKGLERLLLGSVAEWVVRHADVPVMVVPPERGKELAAISESLPVIPV